MRADGLHIKALQAFTLLGCRNQTLKSCRVMSSFACTWTVFHALSNRLGKRPERSVLLNSFLFLCTRYSLAYKSSTLRVHTYKPHFDSTFYCCTSVATSTTLMDPHLYLCRNHQWHHGNTQVFFLCDKPYICHPYKVKDVFVQLS